MGNVLKINCKELYKTGVYITSQVKELNNVINHMQKINEEIKSAWDGADYDSFYNNFSEYLDSIKNLEYSLIDQTAVIKSVAIKHGIVDKDLCNNLSRGLNDER